MLLPGEVRSIEDVRPPRLSRLGRAPAVAAGFLALVVVAAALAPVLSPADPASTDLLSPYSPPSGAHPLGTDALGRDMLSRILWGARPALAGPAVLVLLAMVLGTTVAVASAWIGGRFDAFVSRVVDVFFAFPAIVVALIMVSLAGPGLTSAIIGLLPSYTAFIARVVRSVALRERSLPYIDALMAQGQSGWRICVRHLVPNLMPVVVTQGAASVGYALLDLAALSFLGVGLQSSHPDWGVLLSNAQQSVVSGEPWELVVVGSVVVGTLVALNTLSDRFVVGRST